MPDVAESFIVGPDRLRHLRDGREAFPAMARAIDAAQREIVVEMYWLASDDVGRRFVERLAARARSGVAVRVVIDAIGSAPIDRAIFDALRRAGGDVRIFHPFGGLRRISMVRGWRRDHRKVVVCDGEVGFTGGVNIGAPWAPVEEGGGGWRDDMIEVRGPSAAELRRAFYTTWRRVLPIASRRDPKLMPSDTIGDGRVLHPDCWVMASPSHRGWIGKHEIRRTFLQWIRDARRSICISNPYFVPDRVVRKHLVEAAARGVDVKILVPERGDVAIVQWACEASLEPLVAGGVRVWAYRKTVFHAKTTVIDDERISVGSYNLDHRSFKYNLELNLAVRSADLGAELRRSFERDLGDSVAWDLATLRARGMWRRMLGRVALSLARFL